MNRKGYEINYITNTITVSKKFLEQASTLGGDTYETMKALRELGMPIVLEKMKKRKSSSRLTYRQMLHHISCLADAKHYLAEFEAVRKASKGEEHPYKYVENWYESKIEMISARLSITNTSPIMMAGRTKMHRHAHPPPSGSLVLPLFLVWRKSYLKTRGPATSNKREDEENNKDYISHYPSPRK